MPLLQVTGRWLAVRVEFISNTVMFTTALMVSAVLPVNAGFAGLAITAAVNLTDNLSVFVRMVRIASHAFCLMYLAQTVLLQEFGAESDASSRIL